MSDEAFTVAINFRRIASILRQEGHADIPPADVVLSLLELDPRERELFEWTQARINAGEVSFMEQLGYYLTND